jgi:hypothetical protein
MCLENCTEDQGLDKDKEVSDSLIDDDEETSMLDSLSSEQLARRPSFKYIIIITS